MRSVLAIIVTIQLAACCTVPHSATVSPGLPTTSMVKIDRWGVNTHIGHGTGFYIGDGVVITAGHVCSFSTPGHFLTVKTGDGMFAGTPVAIDVQNDLCTISSPNMTGAIPVRIAEEVPTIGGRVYAISAPGGWEDLSGGTVHITAGVYLGEWAPAGTPAKVDAYNLSIAPGSSGGMIVNARGELTGVILGFAGVLQDITASPLHSVVKKHIERSK